MNWKKILFRNYLQIGNVSYNLVVHHFWSSALFFFFFFGVLGIMPVPARHCQLSAQGWPGSEFIPTPLRLSPTPGAPLPHISLSLSLSLRFFWWVWEMNNSVPNRCWARLYDVCVYDSPKDCKICLRRC
jgi:hypothetical protein